MLQAISSATASGPLHSRWAAIVHASVYDAVVSFTGDAEPYGGIQVFAARGASVEAAVIAAAHYALVHLFRTSNRRWMLSTGVRWEGGALRYPTRESKSAKR